MVSSRTLSSHYLEINPQTLTQAPLIACMDHEDCKAFPHLKGKIQVLLQLNPLKISQDSLLFGFLDVFARNGGIHLFSLETRMTSALSQSLVTRNSPKPQAKLPSPIQSLLGLLSEIKESLVALANKVQKHKYPKLPQITIGISFTCMNTTTLHLGVNHQAFT